MCCSLEGQSHINWQIYKQVWRNYHSLFYVEGKNKNKKSSRTWQQILCYFKWLTANFIFRERCGRSFPNAIWKARTAGFWQMTPLTGWKAPTSNKAENTIWQNCFTYLFFIACPTYTMTKCSTFCSWSNAIVTLMTIQLLFIPKRMALVNGYAHINLYPPPAKNAYFITFFTFHFICLVIICYRFFIPKPQQKRGSKQKSVDDIAMKV